MNIAVPIAAPRLAWYRRAFMLPGGIFLVALALRLIDLGRRPFWLDEVFTWQRASLAPRALVHDSFMNHHLPSFFLLLSPFVPLGNPQFWLRLPPAVFGAFSIMLVYLIGKQVAGRNAGLAAALMLGLSPTALAFSQEARSYTMVMAMILVALLGLAKLAMDLPAAARDVRLPDGAAMGWGVFVLGSAAALDVLGDGLPWLLTANLIIALLLRQSGNPRGLLRNLLLADAAILLLTAPFYALMATTQHEGFVDSVMWIPPLNLPRLWYDLSSVYLLRVADSVTFRLMDVPTPVAVMWAIELAVVCFAALGAWVLRRRPQALALLGLSFMVLPLCLAIVSIWRPILLPRYILWSAAPFSILAGIGASVLIDRLPRRAHPYAFAAAAMVLLLNLAPYYGAETKPRWDIAAKMLAGEVGPGDVIYLDDKGALPILRLYLPAGTQQVVLQDSDGDLNHALQAQQQGKRVWVVFGHAGQSGITDGDVPRLFAAIAPLGTPSQIQLAGNRIYITLFDQASHGISANCTAQPALFTTSPPPATLDTVPCS